MLKTGLYSIIHWSRDSGMARKSFENHLLCLSHHISRRYFFICRTFGGNFRAGTSQFKAETEMTEEDTAGNHRDPHKRVGLIAI